MANQESVRSIEEQMAEQAIFDSDFHNSVSLEQLAEYIETPTVRSKVEEKGVPSGKDHWSPQYSRRFENSGEAIGRASTHAEIVEVMEELYLDSVLINPNLMLQIGTGRYPTVKTELVRAYNDFLVEHLLDESEGIYGTLALPQWDVEASVDELDRLSDAPGVIGAQGWYSTHRSVGNPEFDPIMERLVDLDLPWVFHGDGHNIFDDVQAYPEVLTLGWSIGAMKNVLSLIFGGAFDVHPDLRIVIQEAGINWIPYIANRADEVYQTAPEDVQFTERLYERGQTYLERQPSEYLAEHFYFTSQPIALPKRPAHGKAMLEMIDADERLLFSSDWPHSTSETPDWVFRHPKIDDELRARITYENAAELYGIE